MRWWSRGLTFVSLSYLPRMSFRLEIETSARLLIPPPYVFSEFPSKCGKMGSGLNISGASSSAAVTAVAEAPARPTPGREESEPTDVSKQVPRTALEQKDMCTFVCVHVCVCVSHRSVTHPQRALITDKFLSGVAFLRRCGRCTTVCSVKTTTTRAAAWR